MSMPDITDDVLLGDDDELDYDLEQDEEEALLADPDNYDLPPEEQHSQPHEDTEDVLDIDSNIALDETDDCNSSNIIPVKQDSYEPDESYNDSQVKLDDYNSEPETNDRERNRFLNERNNIQIRSSHSAIPDSLDKVEVQVQVNSNQKNNNRNGRYRGGGGRGNRGGPNRSNLSCVNTAVNRQNHRQGGNVHRGNVFNRVGHPGAAPEGKTVLINPHFRGNVHVNPAARLAWDSNGVAVGGPWEQQAPPPQAAPHYAPPPQHYQQPPLYYNLPPQHTTQQPTVWNQEASYGSNQQGNFRGREVQYIASQPPPLLQGQGHGQGYMGHQHQHQQQAPQYMGGYSDNYGHVPQPMQMHSQYQQQPPLHYQQPQQQPQQHYQQPPPYQHQQQPQQQHYQQQQHTYQQQQVSGQQSRQQPRQQYRGRGQGATGRRRGHEGGGTRTQPAQSTGGGGGGGGESPRKKKRSMDMANLHEVPIVHTPDSTNIPYIEDKTPAPEYEDEETKAYRKKIEEQKRLREKILQQKEQRRKLIALQNEVQTTAEDFKQIVKQAASIQADIISKPNQPAQSTAKPNQITQKPTQKPQMTQKPELAQMKRQVSNRGGMQSRGGVQVRGRGGLQVRGRGGVQTRGRGGLQMRGRGGMQSQGRGAANIVVTQQQQGVAETRRIVVGGGPRRIVIGAGIGTGIDKQVTETSGELKPSSTFLAGRQVIGGNGVLTGQLARSPTVTISNLAATTTTSKIKQLCSGLGPVQNIQMKPTSRAATIQFKNIVSAQKFYKKYQRKIIDLSMIQVCFEPEA